MKFIRVGAAGFERPAMLTDDGRAFDLRPLTPDIDGFFLAGSGVERARAAYAEGTLRELDIGGLRLGAPIARPGKVVCVEQNYRDPAGVIPGKPVVVLKAPDTVVGPEDEVLLPRRSAMTDYAVELAAVIGRRARYLSSPGTANRAIAGYAVSHSVSEREFGKSCETFNPLGPWLVPADEIDTSALELRLTVNGEERQRGRTADMIFTPAHLVWYLSQHMRLEPGDLVNTGTPAGTALGRPDTPFLRAGDIVELGVDGLGTQRQKVGQA
ncbi:MAG TPA: fumarylacetoacetate hydrolase family protein [Actinokineospora sp.]|nr:fumarylacetoacetate hydrolase family protein [Actinokineospora sp.]